MSQDSFLQKKNQILSQIETTLGNVPDISPKGSIDELCVPIMNLINSHNDMVTTSSCSGRVSVFLEGVKVKDEGSSSKIGGKGDGGHWLFVEHDKTKIQDWHKDKFQYGQVPTTSDLSTRYILFKFEPLILHVKCRNYETASALYTTAMGCGFRESGIGINNIVAIRISIKLDIPIGYYNQENDTPIAFVTEEYLQMITQLSLDRFEENERRLNMLYEAISKMQVQAPKDSEQQETKEQRRERKRKEGLAKQQQKQAQIEQIEATEQKTTE
ncbi:tRNA wybutosine-synthesizing protein [Wickerhamomyces ciferrii]|uniref:tRNA wybutosine-synthesizing protein 3 n=1 Tax=Wickerhamomyces ciferrii (strain ATCC 14091 / BCRC 22168 / CBS 111 / JCM 3599 / NBRC 0793 / NRRL Y-1031 F-60-10) TaxID=1206466 RepID=K0KWZ1_WICCF|nr:tRNA wybutosine-synthesizing protein [Wickerhamomyces ciferrii]CCH46567.1 tRNA wybutosine-synthesizing protein [Wickerhamomyces ciferrii]